jgi:ligand-binding SRPBCC domain-containing protein
MVTTVRRSVEIAAPAELVWGLVSDLPAMGRFSPENTGGRWKRGGGPAVGAVFRGTNAQGRRRWSTRCTVTRCDPGSAFAFTVRAAGLPVAEWSYVLAPTARGCALTETWQDRRGRLITRLGAVTTGVQDRAAFTSNSIERTLNGVKAAAERAGAR